MCCALQILLNKVDTGDQLATKDPVDLDPGIDYGIGERVVSADPSTNITALSVTALSHGPSTALSLLHRSLSPESHSLRSDIAAIEAATRTSSLPSPSVGSAVGSVRRRSSLYLAISEALATTVLRQLEKLWILE
ncbi:hypothetical protein Syun_010039 [Stephania yunnanensis]|uniref:Uncharacterized protein n=1 Tax=Stephania yunnanensis TaxID=152371 RepID=A0AAP0KGS8_9MAGN